MLGEDGQKEAHKVGPSRRDSFSMNQGIENSGFQWRTVPETKSKQGV